MSISLTSKFLRVTLLYHLSFGAKLSDHHTDPIAAFDQPAFVRKRHPIGFAFLGIGALAKLPDLFHRWHHEADSGARINQRRLGFFVVERLGLARVQCAVTKS